MRETILASLLALTVCFPQAESQDGPSRHPQAGDWSRSAEAGPSSPNGFAGDLACRDCHADKYDSYLKTPHHLSSQTADRTSISGSFTPGKNVMATFNPQLSFVMKASNENFYEIARTYRNGQTTDHAERIDLVIGSAAKGQTYLYWKEDALFELPVSFWTSLNRWVNSPGYVDGSADFDRPVTPRCLECHATYFQPLSQSATENRYSRSNFVLGISCERCHGSAQQHIRDQQAAQGGRAGVNRMPPAGLARERQIDVCAQCHAGVGRALAPAFSFRAGDKLSDFIVPPQQALQDKVDVHGNQVALLQKSRCFQASPDLSCSTCHDVHAPAKAAASYSDRCLACHRGEQCSEVRRLGTKAASDCIDCHMPVQASTQLTVDTEETRLPAKVRNHWIRVYDRNRP